MGESSLAIHYVCTSDEARELGKPVSRFWVSNCGCRQGRGSCSRSRMDVCLMFSGDQQATGPGKRELDRAGFEALLAEASERNLVCRPFRTDDRTGTAGICFCCDDCCGYFLDPQEACDRGRFVEKTDLAACTQCGLCEDVCYFKARRMSGGELALETERCYGCGLCVTACPAGCIEMAERNPGL